jgi:hypothetical protein
VRLIMSAPGVEDAGHGERGNTTNYCRHWSENSLMGRASFLFRCPTLAQPGALCKCRFFSWVF